MGKFFKEETSKEQKQAFFKAIGIAGLTLIFMILVIYLLYTLRQNPYYSTILLSIILALTLITIKFEKMINKGTVIWILPYMLLSCLLAYLAFRPDIRASPETFYLSHTLFYVILLKIGITVTFMIPKNKKLKSKAKIQDIINTIIILLTILIAVLMHL